MKKMKDGMHDFVAHSCTIESFIFSIHGWMKFKKNQKSILIINFQFELFINSHSEIASYFAFTLAG